MHPEIKEKWLAALATTKQTTAQLRQADSFCCLGVLCNIAEQERIGYWSGTSFVSYDTYEAATLPEAVQDWADFPNHVGTMPFKDRIGSSVDLTDANDGGCTFPQMIDLINYFF